MRRKFGISLFLAVLVLLGSGQPADAQAVLVPGANPESPAIARAGNAQNAVAIAREKGWTDIRQLTKWETRNSRGASGEWVYGKLPPNTWMGVDPSGMERIIGYEDQTGWHGCGNATGNRVIVQTRIQYRDRFVEREVPVPVERTVHVFGPTVYPTAPMPVPSINTFVNRPQINLDLGPGHRSTTTLAGGAGGGGATAKVGDLSNSSMNLNWNQLTQQQQQDLLNQILVQTNNQNQNGDGNAASGTNAGAQDGTNVGQQRQ
ncbi:MAG: hypothetical protein ACOYBJ_03070 [Patescibacteria group bacterium]|jgi:hypothetical protein